MMEGGISEARATAKFTVAEVLAPFLVPLDTYLAEALGNKFEFLATGALVFQGDRLLIVQRAAHDSFPSCWENPGGACDADDETVLHAAARELREEAGLEAARFVRQVGDVFEFRSSRGKKIAKVAFEVEVLEENGDGGDGETEHYHVTLDPKEHQDYKWVTEEEVRNGRVGQVQLQFTTPDNRALMLEGFRVRKAQQSEGSEA